MLRSRVFFAFSAASAITVESLAANPVVPGVSVITEGPAKGHFRFDANDQPVPVFVDQTTLTQMMGCAQTYAGGLRVNAGHCTGVLDAAGFLDSYRLEDNKLRADMTLFPTFEKFSHLCRLIATIPDTFGLSVDFSGPAEFREGKAFARCTEIYSADLVPVPAANDRGLFGFVFCDCGKLTQPFDKSDSGMTLEELSKQVADAVTTLNTATTKVDDALTRLSSVETKLSAIKIPEVPADLGTQLAEIKKTADTAVANLSETQEKLSRRMGLEFAARAGAKPAGEAKPSEEAPSDERKAFEIPSSERNANAVAALFGKK